MLVEIGEPQIAQLRVPHAGVRQEEQNGLVAPPEIGMSHGL